MNLRALRKRCDAIVGQFSVPVPFDARCFCDTVAARRGHPILLRPMPLEPPVYGIWLATGAADFILYERDTSPLHQQHIIVHELAHILCNHQPTQVTGEEWAPPFPELSRRW